MELRQVLRTRKDGTLALGVSPARRVVLASVGVVMAAVMLVVGESSAVGIGIVAVCVLGAAIEDSWAFVPSDGAVVHRRGLALFPATRRYRREEIDELRIRELGSNLGRFHFISLELVRSDGTVVTIEMQKRRDGELVKAARRIAAALSLPLEEEFLSDADS